MAGVVGTVLLKFGLGFLSNTFRTYGAEKLQDGGLTDQKFRGWIVRELDDIKFKLDALSRKDLSASISFLKQGVQRLQMSLEYKNARKSKVKEDRAEVNDTASAGANLGETKPAEQSVTVHDAVALANVIGKLKIESKERFESAKEFFNKAGEKATEAFHNVALSTNERILATEIRIASAILGNLDDTILAATDCLQYLQELHGLPAIRDIFSVHIQGGIKSWFNKDSRTEMVETVTMINLVLADFISNFTKQRMAVFDWPMIECGERVVHPIYYQEESVRKLEEIKITPPWDIIAFKEDSDSMKDVSINSKCDLIAVFERGKHLRKLDRATGEWKPFCPSPSEDKTWRCASIAIDDSDTVYVASEKSPCTYVLSVYSSDEIITYSCPLEFIDEDLCGITVTQEKKIVFWSGSYYESISVYLCDITGRLVKFFPRLLENVLQKSVHVSLDKSPENDIIVAAEDTTDVTTKLYVFTQEGELKRTIKFHSIIKPMRLFQHRHITFDHVTKKYIVYKETLFNESCVEYFTETGELQNSLLLDMENYADGRVVCHANGAMVIVNRGKMYNLRLPLM